MLNIQHLTKVYSGGKRAVDDLSLQLLPGELCGFIGHNGAGKTTTLRAVAGIMSFDGGSISVGNYDIAQQPVEAKRITAFLPDNPDLYDFLSGIKYLTFIADIYQIPAEARQPLIAKYADAFEMTGVLGSPIGSYSHGMKQKLALISAFIRQPRLLLLDEPFVGLDPKASYIMKEFLHELCASGGAVFFSTHVLEVAEKLCDKIAIIKNGKLIAMGPTSDIVGNSSLESVFLELEAEGPAMGPGGPYPFGVPQPPIGYAPGVPQPPMGPYGAPPYQAGMPQQYGACPQQQPPYPAPPAQPHPGPLTPDGAPVQPLPAPGFPDGQPGPGNGGQGQ